MQLQEILNYNDPGNVKIEYNGKKELIGIAVVRLLARIPEEGIDINNLQAIVFNKVFNHPGERYWLIGVPRASYENTERILVEKGLVREISPGVYKRTKKADNAEYTPLIFKNYSDWAISDKS